jgi:hypothetical protein
MEKTLRNVFAVFCAVAIAACATPNKQYQRAGSVEIAPSPRYADNSPYPKLSAIEFDEQGDIWTSSQLYAAQRMIKRSAKRPLLLVFIHGWHNNARANNENLQSFNRLLKQIAEPGKLRDHEVQGVYIGWRGLAIERTWDKTGVGWLARYLSFYSRKNDTDLVAGIPLTSALYTLASDAHSKGGRVIFIGHSFGGRILEKALAQALIGQTSAYPRIKVTLPADLTLLINPASEAITARRLKLALKDWSEKTPAIISVTSKGDTATSTWWWGAMSASTLAKARAFREYEDGPGGRYRTSQKDYVIRTAGHSDILKDRQVVPIEPTTNLSDQADDAIAWNLRFATENQFRAANEWWRIEQIQTSPAPFIINAGQAKGYWVISVPPEIIPDHNDIFRPAAIELFAALYRICRSSVEKPPMQKTIEVPPVISTSTATPGQP